MSRLTRSAVPPPDQLAEDLVAGDLLAGRYRLLSRIDAAPCGLGRPAGLWLARDEVLTRRVAVKALACEPGPSGGSASRFLAAARAAGAVGSPVLARVYDAAVEQRYHGPELVLEPGADVAYVIREWVDGVPLAEALERDGPLPPRTAVTLTAAVGEALAAAHSRGLAHGRLHPGNLLLCRGALRVTDLAVSAALPGGAAPADRLEDGDAVADDVRDLAAVLYALLTGRWPVSRTPQPSGGLPPAAGGGQRSGARSGLAGPRAARPEVPDALDAVVVRALDPVGARLSPPLTSVEQLVAALEQAVATPGREELGGQAPTSPARRRLPPAGAVALLGALGVGAFLAGSSIGGAGAGAGLPLSPTGRSAAGADEQVTAGQDPATPPLPAPGPGGPVRPRALPLSAQDLTDFDPQGDGRERPDTVPAAVDGDPATAWTTERYATAAFGGLKEGVGLLLDLGEPTTVTALELRLSRPGVSVELRGAAARGDDAASYRLLAHGRAESQQLALEPPAGTRERFYLLWVTNLHGDGDGFTAGVDELELRGDDLGLRGDDEDGRGAGG